jgi:hypothetical protein
VQNFLSSSLLSKIVKFNIHRTAVCSVVLYGREMWSRTLSEEHRLGAVENRVLRRIFVPKKDEVTGEWRRLRKEEPHDLYSSPCDIWMIKSRRMRWSGRIARMGREVHAGFYWGNLRQSKHSEDLGIGVDLREVG